MTRSLLRRPARLVTLPLLVVGVVGCDRGRERALLDDAGDKRPGRLEVRVAGCPVLRRGDAGEPLCEVDEHTSLRLWLPGPGSDADLTVRIDGANLEPVRTSTGDGTRLVIKAPAAAKQLVVVLDGRKPVTSEFRLELGPRQLVPEVEAARALRKAGKRREAQARLEVLLDSAPEPQMRAQALGLLGRLHNDQGDTEQAVARLQQAVIADGAVGRISDELRDRDTLGFVLREKLGRHAEARAVLDGVAPLLALEGDAWARDPYSRGLVEYDVGNLREALARFHEAAARSVAIDYPNNRISALQLESEILALLGRNAEVIARLIESNELASRSADPCVRANASGNAGWLLLRLPADARSDGAGHRVDPLPHLQQAVALYRSECQDADSLANALMNWALLESERGLSGDARSRLAEAEAAAPRMKTRLRVWWLGLLARILLDQGDARGALAVCRRLNALEAMGAGGEAQLDAAFIRARAADALGRQAEARSAWEATERLFDSWSRNVALGEGRQDFFVRYRDIELRRIDHLIRTRPAAEAAAAARRSRARALSLLSWLDRAASFGVEERARWERSVAGYRAARSRADELAERCRFRARREQQVCLLELKVEREHLNAALVDALATSAPSGDAVQDDAGDGRHGEAAAATLGAPAAEGELILLFQPLADGWAGFALTTHEARVVRLGGVDPSAAPEALAATLLLPFEREIDAASRIRLLASGALARIDLHALPYHGRPLVAGRTVTWSLDLPASPAADPTAGSGATALLVADPLDDLPATRVESRRVAAALIEDGVTVRQIEGSKAVHDAVREALVAPGLDLFHYAGHARFEGRDGWQSALPLAAGGLLTLGDVLTLARVPPRVLLSGCDTARSADAEFAVGLGLAQAFLLAGARVVIAASRPVADGAASSLVSEVVVARQGGEPSDDLAVGLAHAQAARAAQGDATDWAAFRALTR